MENIDLSDSWERALLAGRTKSATRRTWKRSSFLPTKPCAPPRAFVGRRARALRRGKARFSARWSGRMDGSTAVALVPPSAGIKKFRLIVTGHDDNGQSV